MSWLYSELVGLAERGWRGASAIGVNSCGDGGTMVSVDSVGLRSKWTVLECGGGDSYDRGGVGKSFSSIPSCLT